MTKCWRYYKSVWGVDAVHYCGHLFHWNSACIRIITVYNPWVTFVLWTLCSSHNDLGYYWDFKSTTEIKKSIPNNIDKCLKWLDRDYQRKCRPFLWRSPNLCNKIYYNKDLGEINVETKIWNGIKFSFIKFIMLNWFIQYSWWTTLKGCSSTVIRHIAI